MGRRPPGSGLAGARDQRPVGAERSQAKPTRSMNHRLALQPDLQALLVLYVLRYLDQGGSPGQIPVGPEPVYQLLMLQRVDVVTVRLSPHPVEHPHDPAAHRGCRRLALAG